MDNSFDQGVRTIERGMSNLFNQYFLYHLDNYKLFQIIEQVVKKKKASTNAQAKQKTPVYLFIYLEINLKLIRDLKARIKTRTVLGEST